LKYGKLVIERFIVEIGRKIQPMVCFANSESFDRIVLPIFNRFNKEREKHILRVSTQSA